ncbi:hypothetical protein IFM89_026245 [Coptis chinensis]|uniref:Uncharacterized protein n=1 Tax=Coptis chinensis TaxID=261450 RepID=A0A835HV05_9MAGN|nr:hypothetical protein IFM89_026245 [Coptis chinensis]
MGSSSVITPEDVLESLMNDGGAEENTITMVEQSKVLNTPGAEKQTKRELFDALRQELETPVLEKASKSFWELTVEDDGLGKEISETVERVFYQLSGLEPPFPVALGDAQPGKERQQGNSETSSKKRELHYTTRRDK